MAERGYKIIDQQGTYFITPTVRSVPQDTTDAG
jgi:hypothetical protein